ncbi:MAG TPA: tripartite tricarboxylate transporter substrate binding protein [Bordetella sp.]|nr:tripartite tricarboxylate transporter substrate binding protein [Bordetella sp.]
MAISRRGVLAAVVAGATLPIRGIAQSNTHGVIRIISPYEPGGGTDILGRILSRKFGESLHESVIVDNRPGANGTIGSGYVARSEPDGKTLLVVPAGFAANPTLYPNLPFDSTRDLAPVSLLASGPLVLVVHPSLPVHTVKDLIALAQSRPGALNAGSAGRGSLPSLCAGLFNMDAHTRITEVPYKGAGAAVADLLSGQVQMYFMNVLQCLPLIKAGKLRALGVTTPRRSPIAPDLPTIAESGLPEFDMTNWYGLLVRGGTAPKIIHGLQQECAHALNAEDTRKQLADQGMTAVGGTPEDFAAFLKNEMAKSARIIQMTGLKS